MIVPITIATIAIVALSGPKKKKPGRPPIGPGLDDTGPDPSTGSTRPGGRPSGTGRIRCGPGVSTVCPQNDRFTGSCVDGYCQEFAVMVPSGMEPESQGMVPPTAPQQQAYISRPPDHIAKNGYWADAQNWIFQPRHNRLNAIRLHSERGIFNSLDWNDYRAKLEDRWGMFAWTAYAPDDTETDNGVLNDITTSVLTLGLTGLYRLIAGKTLNMVWERDAQNNGAYMEKARRELLRRATSIVYDPRNFQLGLVEAGDDPGTGLRWNASRYVWIPPYGANQPSSKPN